MTEQEFTKRKEDPNCILGLWDDNVLVGYVIYKIPDSEETEEFNVDDSETILLDGLAVKQEYRGKGCQIHLLNIFEEHAKQNVFHSIVASVHPDNVYSLTNFEKQQYKVIAEKDLFYGHRYIIKKHLKRKYIKETNMFLLRHQRITARQSIVMIHQLWST